MRVVFLTACLTQYRVPFHDRVRAQLASAGIQYDVIYGQPDVRDATKRDFVDIAWGKRTVNRYLHIAGAPLVWQPALRELWHSDLAIIGQENRLLVNYPLQSLRRFMPGRLALWGHGRNFQANNRGLALAEHWKRLWLGQCDWWFAYTEETRRILERSGYPTERITVFHNAIDTSEIGRQLDQISEDEIDKLRRELGLGLGPVAVYVGGIHDHKRIDFLIASTVEVHKRMNDFRLIVVGGGPEQHLIEAAAMRHSWIRYLGPRFGREKVKILRLGRVFLMPGLVGLAVLDCAAAGLPIITTAYPYHSPEIAYLQHDMNGIIVDNWHDPSAYADAVVAALLDSERLAKLSQGARELAKRYTIEGMAAAFVEGVTRALMRSKH